MPEEVKEVKEVKEAKEEAHPTVEEHAEALGVPPWAFAGLKARMGWAVGVRVSRAQFERALREFLSGPTAKEGS
ncbi:hypothetical protein [Thermus sp.]|uniref:hypothetical protein n=1 Tax=Thermus sp. TaxID=275 RepID=UPI0025D6948F|nr:hypothetical protein [Thermus sp.]MCS6867502.1 hypothetical protein [Thermus sp.]MDW8357854.1 hypothetical protein [Thermus sp.]